MSGCARYRALAERNTVQPALCRSHVRRRINELAAAGPATIDSEALERIAALYRIETENRGLSAEERSAIRQAKSRPITDAPELWLTENLSLINHKTKLAEAIGYAPSRWERLTRFMDDGRIEFDSNIVEHAIRPIALNRKNVLLDGSDGGGALGRHRLADRDLQTQQYRSTGLSRPRPHKDRQRAPTSLHR